MNLRVWHQFPCLFSTLPNNSSTPAGYPTIQLNYERHCLPKNQMLPATRLPPSDTNHKAGLSPKLLTSPLNNWLEDSTTSSLGSINLAERLTGLRETFYFRAYWFIIKGYNLGRVRKKRYTRQGMWESVRSSHALWTSLSPNLHVVKTRRSPNSILLDFKGGFID